MGWMKQRVARFSLTITATLKKTKKVYNLGIHTPCANVLK